MSSELNAEFLGKLDMLIKLQALNAVGRFESSREKILFLSRVGMQPKEIAELLQTSPNTVSVTLSKSKKGKKPDAI